MNKFKIKASYISTCETIIEAKNQDEAYRIAQGLDGGCFDVRLSGDDWQIDSVSLMEDTYTCPKFEPAEEHYEHL